MEKIKGLMIKDLLQLKSYKKTLLIFMAVFILITMTNEDISSFTQIIIVMITLVFGMLGIALVANLLITAVPIGGGTISEMFIISMMGFPVAELPI